MSADRFEALLADWLEDGPETAPGRLVEASLVHAGAHPRSRPARITRRVRRHGRVLAAAAAVIALLAGTYATLPRFREAPTRPIPASITGTESCAIRIEGITDIAQDPNQVTGRIDVCTHTASDARVSGELTRQLSGAVFSRDSVFPLGSSNYWGTAVLRNADGAWTGTLVATYSGSTETTSPGRATWVGLGSGAYAGLSYRVTAAYDDSGRGTLTGQITPISNDAVTANTWCVVSSASPEISVDNPPNRTMTRTCVITSQDARLAGSATENRTVTVAADGATSDRGDIDITTAGGGWTGAFSGTGNFYVAGSVTGELNGTDSFAGQHMSFTIYSEDGMHGAFVGEIQPR